MLCWGLVEQPGHERMSDEYKISIYHCNTLVIPSWVPNTREHHSEFNYRTDQNGKGQTDEAVVSSVVQPTVVFSSIWYLRRGLQKYYNNTSVFYTRLTCVHVQSAQPAFSTSPPLPCETHPAQRPSINLSTFRNYNRSCATYCRNGVVTLPSSPFNTQSVRVPTTPAYLFFLPTKIPASHRTRVGTSTVSLALGANRDGKKRFKGKASRVQSIRTGSALVCVRRNVQYREQKPSMYVCMYVCMYVRMYVCMHVCMNVFTYIY